MKKIHLRHFTEPKKDAYYVKHKFYKVYLGNGHFEDFTNKTQVKKYLADASRFLNFKMFEINELLATSYCVYRRFWFKFYDTAKGSNYLSLEYDVRNALDAADDSLDRSWQKCDLRNGNHFAFDFMFKSLGFLKTANSLLQQFARQKNLMDQVLEIEVTLSRIRIIKNTLKSYRGVPDEHAVDKQLKTEILDLLEPETRIPR